MEPIDDPSVDANNTMCTDRHRRRYCCCFFVPESWERIHFGVNVGGGEDRWWWNRVVGAVMKVREWSELVAGPRWKTFIRRFNRNRSGGGGWGRMGTARFQYDPLSYSLNFDEGHRGSPEEGEYTGYSDFSARFTMPPASAKSFVEVGGSDAAHVLSAVHAASFATASGL